MIKSIVMSLLLVLLVFSTVWSGQISPFLADHLQEMTVSNEVDVVIMLSDQADIASLNSQLKQEKATLEERNKRVIEALQEKASLTQPLVLSYLDDLQSQGLINRYKAVWISNMFIVTANKAGIEAIADLSEVSDLYYNYQIESISPVDISESDPPLTTSIEIGLARINAPAAWAAGFTGAGRVVANMDTGVDGTHPALSDRFRGDVDNDGDVDESWYDPYAGWTFPQDSGSHGTHTIGTICGRSPAGDTIGVAIDAQWIAAAPIDRGGGIPGTIADAILSFQWFVDPDGNPETQDNPDAVGNSWGISPIYHGVPACDETFWTVIDNLEAAGTAVIWSAGNEGNQADAVRTPADRATTQYNCFSVGSVNGALPHLPISSFSSCGPVYCTPDGSVAIKPEVVAPGDNVRSSVPGGGYSTMSGTSMASPHITGAVGVIRSANPDLDVDSIKEILMATAFDLGDEGNDNFYGYGIIDLYEACLVAQQGYGFVEGYVYNEDSNPLNGAIVNVVGSTRLSYTNVDGFYHIGLPADTSYTLAVSFFGYLPDTAVVAIVPDQTTNQDFYLDYAEYGFLYGHVYDLDSNPLENAMISVADSPLDPVYSNSDGYYYFDIIPNGATYTIEATANGYGYSSASVYIPVDDSVSQDFYLQVLESFEFNDGGYVGSGCWEWGSPSSGPGSAYDGINVWGTALSGSYPNDADDWLVTIPFEINNNLMSYSFYHWFNMENSWDGGNIQISTDGGSSWNVITPEGGYPDNSVVGLDGEPGFTSTSSDWQQCVIDLSMYTGYTVQFAFRFGTDGSVTRDGWYIDAVILNPGTNESPEADVSPTSFEVGLAIDESVTYPLTISNSGGLDLDFTVAVFADGRGLIMTVPNNPAAPREYKGVTVENKNAIEEKGYDAPFNHDIATDFGGPDDFGYMYIDSDEPNGPEYNWVDISGIGEIVNFTYGSIDDGYTDLLPMGMSFEYYGLDYSDIMVSTNGWISFQGQTSSHLSNDPIPDVGEPNAVIAVEWDDLDGGDTGLCYKYYDGENNQFIVSWIDWHYYPDGNTPAHDFQVILNGDDNSIIMQYGDIDGEHQSDISIGIENEFGDIGLQYAYNNAATHPGLAIKYTYPLFWLTVNPLEGTVPPSSSTDLDVTFNSEDLSEGTYTGSIIIATNDPDNNQITVPCILHVTTTGIDDKTVLVPSVFSLSQNYPNPFNPTTEISFGLPSSGHVSLEIYDIIGRKVITLINKELNAGIHNITWDSSDESGEFVASGVYFYKLKQADNVITKKMMMLK